MIWINLIAVIIFVLLGISAYRKEDLIERMFINLQQNYQGLLAQRILENMEKVDPEQAKKLRKSLPIMPPGSPKISTDPGNMNPQDTDLETLLMLDRFRKTMKGGAK